jgi:tRNA-2-methylthio-N6-dimethylallyladenosine synthase
MNVLDSELVGADMVAAGYEMARSKQEADVILFNTCSVRAHAEEKVYSALGRLKNVKEHYPNKIIGVIGCMAQKDRETIFRRAPHVDLVVGPGQIAAIPTLIQRVADGEAALLEVSLDRNTANRLDVHRSFEQYDPARLASTRRTPRQALVRVMFGCDNFCSYCIVPSVRGPEQSRDPREIKSEIRRLAESGCVEVTLIGQAVDAYRFEEGDRTFLLADLLRHVHDVDGVRRIKFVTNHPRYMTRELIEAVRDLDKVCPYFHVPAQSGSDAVLARMGRGYTETHYREMIDLIRETVPEATITSDFIVGFCGETEEDFEKTVALVRDCRFKNSFIFKYSPRPGTKAAERFEDDVPYDVKQRRNNDLLAVQNAISEEDHKALIGTNVEILVEGVSKTGLKRVKQGSAPQLTGRTSTDRIVVFDGPETEIGRFITVHVTGATAFTLFGDWKERT